MIITRGYGLGQLIILRGFGTAERVPGVPGSELPIVLPPDYLYSRRYPLEVDLRQEFLDFLTATYDEIDLRKELLLEFTIDDIVDISLRDELIEFFNSKSAMPEIDLRMELREFYEDAASFKVDLREELHELLDREQFEIDLRKELEEFLT